MAVKSISIGFGSHHKTSLFKLQERLSKAGHDLLDPIVATDRTGGIIYLFDICGLSDDAVLILTNFFEERNILSNVLEDVFSFIGKKEYKKALNELLDTDSIKKAENDKDVSFKLNVEEI